MNIRRDVIASVLALLATCILAGSVVAHALLVRSTPEANAELAQAPATIEMWFSEPLESGLSTARVLDSSGRKIPTGAALVDPSDHMHMTLPLGELKPGIYTVAYKTLSQVDGHEWFGSFPFTLLNPDGSRPLGTAASVDGETRSETPTPAQVASRWLSLLGSILFLGAPLFQRVVVVRKPSRTPESLAFEQRCAALVVKAIGVAAVAVVAGSWLLAAIQATQLENIALLPRLIYGTRVGALALARQALVVAGLLVALWLTQAWPLRGRLRNMFVVAAVAEAILLLLVLLSALQGEATLAIITLPAIGIVAGLTLRARRRSHAAASRLWEGLLFLGLVALLTVSSGSHAGAVRGSFWAVLGDYVHLLAAAAWIGGLLLLPILVLQVRRSPETRDRRALWSFVPRYSYLASFAVFLLIVTGVFNSLVEFPSVSSLFTTAYGRALIIKLLLMALVLGIAFLNNRLVHRRSNRPRNDAELLRFNRQVGLEAMVSLALMFSVAVFVQTQPPGSLAAATPFQPDLPFNDIVPADDLNVHVQVTPNRPGENRFWVHLYHTDGSPIGEVQLVRLVFNYRDAELGQANADLNPLGQDTFGLEGTYVNQSGLWDVSVYVRRRGMDDALADLRLDVPAPREATTTEPASDPLQNPIPALPIDGLLGGMLIVVGVIPLIWHQLFRRMWPAVFPTLALIGGVFILVGVLVGAEPVATLVTNLTAPEETVVVLNNPIPATPDSIEQGRAVYRQNCSSCHGPNGAGDGPLAATLDPAPANLRVHLVQGIHSDAQIFNWITKGFPNSAMPAFGDQLTEQERWHVINFIRTLAAGG
jgi:copper transport protein